MQTLNDFIHNLALVIGYTVLTLVPLVYGICIFLSMAERARRKVDVESKKYTTKPFTEEHEKGFSDDTFVDFKVKNKLEYSSN